MLKISPAIQSHQVKKYHQLEYTSREQSYYQGTSALVGTWHGSLATTFGLSGDVTPEHFTRLADGQHPRTGVQMVKHAAAQQRVSQQGQKTSSLTHRAGWDGTFSAPKSVSLTALVGGDDRVRDAHIAAVTVALNELEKYTHARIGRNHPAELTGQFVVARFEHDTARPVNGYAAPQLHTHAVIFNVTERRDGSTRALQELPFFQTQAYATAVYQSALTHQLRRLGYELEAGKSGAPEIKGYSAQYLEASSPRSQVIQQTLAQAGVAGPAAAQIAALKTRGKKSTLTPAEVLKAHKDLAATFGNQQADVVAEAQKRVASIVHAFAPAQVSPKETIAYAKERNFEREAVADERMILRDALRRGMGETRPEDVIQEFASHRAEGAFRSVLGRRHDSGRRYTSPEMIAAERANIRYMQDGRNTIEPMLSGAEARRHAAAKAFLNDSQRNVIVEVLTSRDRVHGLQGLAGTGKTTTLDSIRAGAEQGGYTVEGFAPTSRAAGQLREAGMEATTLQGFLARGKNHPSADSTTLHLYLVDETSLASTRQVRAFFDKLHPQNRVLVIGDVRQHEGVDAGRPFQQLQDAGMQTAALNRIVRQKDPSLLAAVQHLAANQTEKGIDLLQQQGRVTEIADGKARIAAIARDYAANFKDTIVVSPDNKSRQRINEAIRAELLQGNMLGATAKTFSTLSHRGDMMGADRKWAGLYQPGDVVAYTRGSEAHGIPEGAFGVVREADFSKNSLTVKLEGGIAVAYDPKRLYGVNVYREAFREFANGDRIQFTAASKEMGVTNRDLGTIVSIVNRRITVALDGAKPREITFDADRFRHLDHGYAVTSHSAQGLTTGRVLVHVDTDSPRSLINTRLAYVAISRASHDARIYTNDAAMLGTRLAAEVDKTTAIQPLRQQTTPAPQNVVQGKRVSPPPLQATAAKILSPSQGQAVPSPAAPAGPRHIFQVGLTPAMHAQLATRATSAQSPATSVATPRLQTVEYASTDHRLAAVANDYANRPHNSIVIATDSRERAELTQLIRSELLSRGLLAPQAWVHPILVEREVADPGAAAHYGIGDTIRFRTGSPVADGIAHGSEATVVSHGAAAGTLRIRTGDMTEVSYDPDRLRRQARESTIYRGEKLEVTIGERIRFTAAERKHLLHAGDLGTVESIAADRGLTVRLDTGRTVQLTPDQARHIHYGYAVGGKGTVGAERLLVTGEGIEQARLPGGAREVTLYPAQPEQGINRHIEPTRDDHQTLATTLTRNSPAQIQDFGLGL